MEYKLCYLSHKSLNEKISNILIFIFVIIIISKILVPHQYPHHDK